MPCLAADSQYSQSINSADLERVNNYWLRAEIKVINGFEQF